MNNEIQNNICPNCNAPREPGKPCANCIEIQKHNQMRRDASNASVFIIIYIITYIAFIFIGYELTRLGKGLSGGEGPSNLYSFLSCVSAAGIFAFIPFALSLYYATKAKARSLLIFNYGFLVFNIILYLILEMKIIK